MHLHEPIDLARGLDEVVRSLENMGNRQTEREEENMEIMMHHPGHEHRSTAPLDALSSPQNSEDSSQ